MTASPALDLAYRVVQRPDRPRRLMVLLHGYGQPVAEMVDRLALIDPDGTSLVVVPTAPFEHRGRRVWFRALMGSDEAATQLFTSLASLDALVGRLAEEHGLPSGEALVGGFSQGGGLGLAMLFGADVVNRPRAAFGICSFPPHVQGFRVDRVAAKARPALLTGDHDDRYSPIIGARSGAATFRQIGLDLTYAESSNGHVMTDEAAALIGSWVRSLDGGVSLPDGSDLLVGVEPRAEVTDLFDLVT